jgi:hypothetical protein
MIMNITIRSTGFWSEIAKRFNEGGPIIMTLILVCLILSVVFITKAFLGQSSNDEQSKKMLRLAADVGLLGLVIGFFGSILGLIQAFDTFEGVAGSMSPELLAGGLKVSFLTVLFGTITFIISRIGILIYKWK